MVSVSADKVMVCSGRMKAFFVNFFLVLLPSSLVAKEEGMEETRYTNYVITEKGVGSFGVSKNLPTNLSEKDFLEHYFCGYIGDGIPVEGLSLFEGQIRVFMKSGPFQRKARSEAAEPECASFAPRAFREAKKGVKVSMISVLGAIARTDKGIAVGATLKALKEAYPDIAVHPVPPTMGHDECVATSKSLPNVRFFFESCKEAQEEATIVRIDVVTTK
jgi:hypothetical protein